MAKTDTDTPRPPRRKRARRFGIWLLLSVALLAMVFLIAVLSLTERSLLMPDWVTSRIEHRLNKDLAPVGLQLGAVEVEFSRHAPPQVQLQDVTLSDGAGRPLVQVENLETTLSGGDLMQGSVVVRHLALNGAHFQLRRDALGEFDLALGETVTAVEAASLSQALEQVDAALSVPALAAIETVSVEALELTYTDARAGREWHVWDGLLALEQTDETASMQLFFALTGAHGTASEVAINFEKDKNSLTSRMSTNFSDVPAGDIATQSPALAFLSVIDAPISGAVRTGVNADGSLAPLSAALEIGEGALRPVKQASAIRFDQGRAYFSYAPEQDKITLTEVSVRTGALSMQAEGHAYLRDAVDGWPTSLITQLQLRQVEIAPEGVFTEPARFETGAVDMKVALDPFTVTLGQVQLSDPEGASYRASGSVAAQPEGWKVGLDIALDQITEAGLLQMWPTTLVPKTRQWVSDNVNGGEIFDVKAAVRLAPDTAPVADLSYEFRDATVRFMKTMPPVEQGVGYSSISGNAFTMVLDSGFVTAPEGGLVNAAGTVVRVGDIRQRPATGEITLKTDSSVQAMLSLLDLPPLQIMSRAGQPTDLASGRAQVEAKLTLPFIKGTQPDEVDYQVQGFIQDVRSTKLVPNRVLAAQRLELRADKTEVTIAGQATLDGVPVQGMWTQPVGPEKKGQSRVEGTVELSQRAVDAFKIGLPAGSVSGAGVGNMVLELAKGAPAKFTLTSDLNRVGLTLGGLGWSKAQNATGNLAVTGTLGQPAAVDSLEFSAPGLSATGGQVRLRAEGGLDALRFEQVKVGNWLQAPVVLTGQGVGAPPRVALTGGSMDLSKSPFMSGGSGGGGSGSRGPIDVALDRLAVTKGIVLRNVNGVLAPGRALQGTFSALVDGGAPVSVALTPHENGTAIRVQSKNAGAVLRGAGIFEKSNSGEMNLSLVPLAGQQGYTGRMLINSIRVQDAPTLAALLSAVSVVGILEMMDGEGLMFSQVDALFRLTPSGIAVKSGSAVGPSLGISAEGIFDFTRNRLDMQGVVSPIYLFNSVGQIVSKRGEGLFGFNYSIKGDPKSPRVRVNPLSILTPGFFREIFRSDPPELPK